MKQVKRYVLFLVAIMASTIVKAQDTVVTTTSEELWYLEPWVWIAGGVVLLLLLMALFRGGRKKRDGNSRTDRVIITKTVRTETDTE